MKKILIVALLAVFLGSTVELFAKESSFFAKTVFVSRITAHQKGYRVTYWKSDMTGQTVYIPIEWFSKNGEFKTDDGFTQAEFVYGIGPSYPFLQIFWKEGKFHHLRLFVNQDYNDPSWGVLQDNENISSFFDPAKALELKF